MKPKTSFSQKIILITLGIICCVILFEISLHLGGLVFTSLQEYRNYLSVKQKGAYRILCLGESTTAGQYPPFLEEVLNQRNIGIKFCVIDKGVPAIPTSYILAQLENNLNKYNPNMVIAMMGINVEGIKYYEDIPDANTKLFNNFRTYRFLRIIWMHIKTALGYMDQKKRIIKLQPDPFNSRLKDYIEQADSVRFADNLNQYPRLNSDSIETYVKLGNNYRQKGQFIQAEEAFKKALELNPQDYRIFVELARFYRMSVRNESSEEAYKKAIELRPQNDDTHCELGNFYGQLKQYLLAEEMFKKAIEINPRNSKAYTELGWVFSFQGKYAQAEKVLKKAIELQPRNYLPYASLIVLYKEIGRDESAEECYKRAQGLGLAFYDSNTQSDYLKLKRILDTRRIQLVCVQYPMRSIQQLEKMLEQEKGIIFVDNEKIFKEALRRGSYREYFVDMCGGDFGHCTSKGNRLLAENIASVILKEVFGR